NVRSSLTQTLASLAPLRRRGLRRRLSAVLIAATLGPVIAVSVVAVVLIFSSVEQGIEFEAVRGLQVARSLFLKEVQEVSSRAAARRVGRAALPLADPALRLLGALVVSVPVDGLVADRLKAALGAGRDVIIYRNGEPSTSTFIAATGARLVGPRVPQEVLKKNL